MSATRAAAHAVDNPRPRWPGSVTTPMSSYRRPTKNAQATATGRSPSVAAQALPDAASPAGPPQDSAIQAIDGASAPSAGAGGGARPGGSRRAGSRTGGSAESGSSAMIRSQTPPSATSANAGTQSGDA